MGKVKYLLPYERHRRIFEKVLKEHTITIAELVQEFNVSEMTIRRDLQTLENEGKVEQVYGGVTSISRTPFELSFAQRELVNQAEKRAIGYAAAQLVHDGDVIALDGSSTTVQLARNLHFCTNLNVITNGVKPAIEMAHRPGISVILTGGELFQTTSLVGPYARATLERLRVEKLFLSVTGINVEMGLSGPSELDSEIKACMIAIADQVILLADSTKFGRQSYTKVAPLADIHVVVSDAVLSKEWQRILEELGIKVILANIDESG